MRRARHLVASAAVAVTAISTLAAGDATVAAVPRVRVTGAVLTGRAEVPGPGDPDGFGAAGVIVDTVGDKVCYVVAVRGIDTVLAAHIHRGAAGVAGPVVVPLEAPTDGLSAACADVEPALADEIAGGPRGFYVNVHTSAFPMGAVRGQLR
jgi:hypothetical protein